jgi:hypothetical protein
MAFECSGYSVAFLAFPCSPVLVERVAGFDELPASWADEDPIAAFIDPNAIESIARFLAALAYFGANAFDGQISFLVGWGIGIARPRTLVSRHASSCDQRFSHATGGTRKASIRTASDESPPQESARIDARWHQSWSDLPRPFGSPGQGRRAKDH